MPPPLLVLASSSPYRAELLRRLRLDFRIAAADIEELSRPGETPPSTAARLAEAKARAVAKEAPGALIIGSDQVLDLNGEALSKPGSRAGAEAQLARLSGKTVTFYTALCLLNTRTGTSQATLVPTVVTFRPLTDAIIRRYLDLEPAWDCAGSAKAEGLGICLMDSLQSEDPTALIGLPLIALTSLLSDAGVELPA